MSRSTIRFFIRARSTRITGDVSRVGLFLLRAPHAQRAVAQSKSRRWTRHRAPRLRTPQRAQCHSINASARRTGPHEPRRWIATGPNWSRNHAFTIKIHVPSRAISKNRTGAIVASASVRTRRSALPSNAVRQKPIKTLDQALLSWRHVTRGGIPRLGIHEVRRHEIHFERLFVHPSITSISPRFAPAIVQQKVCTRRTNSIPRNDHGVPRGLILNLEMTHYPAQFVVLGNESR